MHGIDLAFRGATLRQLPAVGLKAENALIQSTRETSLSLTSFNKAF